MSHHIIEMKNLEYIYTDGKRALDDVTFKINHGECVGIIGANGAGR